MKAFGVEDAPILQVFFVIERFSFRLLI